MSHPVSILARDQPAARQGPFARLFVEAPSKRADAGRRAEDAIKKTRAKIWELSPNLHCAIVGTCLATAEARRLLSKLGAIGVDALSEHEVHAKTVALGRQPDEAGRALNKALDRAHQLAIKRFAAAGDEETLAGLWEAAMARAEIAGAFWAVLTHPMVTPALAQRAFGEIHMLSHLMGAANRADIRRLRQLEAEKAALEDRLARQQAHLQRTLAERDGKLAELKALLEKKTDEIRPDAEALRYLVEDLRRQLADERDGRLRGEDRLSKAATELELQREERRAIDRHLARLTEELAAAEARLAEASEAAADGNARRPLADLRGCAILYVGGRPNQVPHLRHLSERCSASFLYHEGGEDRGDKLPSMVARCDAVLFPVDCVSHDAALGLKRLCRKMAKRYIPLRTASLSAYVAALTRLGQETAERPDETQRA